MYLLRLLAAGPLQVDTAEIDILLVYLFGLLAAKSLQVDMAGIDILLVGDSVGMVVHGHDTTLPVTLEDILVHCKAVFRGTRRWGRLLAAALSSSLLSALSSSLLSDGVWRPPGSCLTHAGMGQSVAQSF